MDRLGTQPHGMPRVGKFFLISVILVAVSLACVTQGSAQPYPYPYVGNYPVPMQPGKTFPYQDPLFQGAYNSDGTNSLNPVISAGTQTVPSGVTYNLQTLTSSTGITFKGQNYTVYSAVPQTATITMMATRVMRSHFFLRAMAAASTKAGPSFVSCDDSSTWAS